MWINSSRPILALAPMADMTDSPFCRVCREVAATRDHLTDELALPNNGIPRYARNDKSDFVIFREMVSSEALVRDSVKTLKMCEFHESERPIVIQIFGANPYVIRQAARIAVDKFHPDGIDINMGCPVPKIAGRITPESLLRHRPSDVPQWRDKEGMFAGAALMKDSARAAEIVRELKKEQLGVPVTIKTRLGWTREDEILEFAPSLQEAGADAIIIHGRTKTQGYSGKSNWEMIAQVKKKLNIPIIANGDVVSFEDAARCLEITGADGVMIGRGALGNPWILNKSKVQSPKSKADINDIIKVVLRHAELHIEHYGERSMVTFRKHLAWYFKGDRIGKEISNIRELRSKLVRVSSFSELKGMLASFYN